MQIIYDSDEIRAGGIPAELAQSALLEKQEGQELVARLPSSWPVDDPDVGSMLLADRSQPRLYSVPVASLESVALAHTMSVTSNISSLSGASTSTSVAFGV